MDKQTSTLLTNRYEENNSKITFFCYYFLEVTSQFFLNLIGAFFGCAKLSVTCILLFVTCKT